MGKIGLVEQKVDTVEALTLTRDVLKTIYQHVKFLSVFRYRRAIEVLQTRNPGYETEDFVQEVVEKVINLFKTKTFPSIKHLKKMIGITTEYHYLHEKRKLFYTKSRGQCSCVSLDNQINDNKDFIEVISDSKGISQESIYDLDRLFSKNLYIAYNWSNAIVITKEQFKQYRDYYLISVNHFIKSQMELGKIETCKAYKNKGCYITKNIFDTISQIIIDYLKENDILLIGDLSDFQPYHKPSIDSIEKKPLVCTCGAESDSSNDLDNNYWQCPVCGRIHDKKELRDYNSGKLLRYNCYKADLKVEKEDEDICKSKIVTSQSIEDTRNTLIKSYDSLFDNINNITESTLEDKPSILELAIV